MEKDLSEKIRVKPLTPDTWKDFEALFEPNDVSGGCWCMWWRIKRSEFREQRREGNKKAMKAIVDSGVVPGLIAYAGGIPVGWCSVAPREDFPVLDRSRNLKRIDGKPVWSITCFFIAEGFRNMGMTEFLIKAAVEYAAKNGASIVEAYPISGKGFSTESFTGLETTFVKFGFEEAARRSPARPIVRYRIG